MKIIDPSLLIHKRIKNLFIELTEFTSTTNFSNTSFEIILNITEGRDSELVRFIADNDKVEIQNTEILEGCKIYNSISEFLKKKEDIETFEVIDLTDDINFKLFVNQTIQNIELEKYLDGELIGFRVTLDNEASFEVYPNDYMTSGHFHNVELYFPEKIKYLADKSFWEKV